MGNGDAAGQYRYSVWRPVTPGEVVEVSYDYFWDASTSPTPAVYIRFANGSKSYLAGSGTILQPPAVGAGWRKMNMRVTAPAGAVFAQLQAGNRTTGTTDSFITNVSALRTGAGYASAADARALSQSLADDQQALATYRTQANARLDNAETGISQQANATQTLTTRVGNIEGVNTNQAVMLTSLQSSMYGPDGEVRAQATAINALTTRVSDTEGGVQSLAGSVQAITARTDRTYASGLFRVSSEAAPSGSQTRIGLRAEAGTTDTSHSAAMYLEARSDGTSQAGFVASRFFIAHGNAQDSLRQVPFYVDSGKVYIDAAFIRAASIGTLELAGNAVTVPVSVNEPAEVRLSTVGAQGNLSAAAINNPTGAPVFILFTCQQAGYGAAMCDYILYRGSNQLRAMRNTSFDNGQQTSMVFSAVDMNPPVGAVNYFVRGAKFSSGGYTNDPSITNRSIFLMAVQR